MAGIREFILRVSHDVPYEIRGLTVNTIPIVEKPVASNELELSFDIAHAYVEPVMIRWTVLASAQIPKLAAVLRKDDEEIALGEKQNLAGGDRWRSAAKHPKQSAQS